VTTIPQRELRNQSGEVLRRAAAGEVFVVTVEGCPVARLSPLLRLTWVSRTTLEALIRDNPADPAFFDDLSPFSAAV
jgi:prevent-host-death family protein